MTWRCKALELLAERKEEVVLQNTPSHYSAWQQVALIAHQQGRAPCERAQVQVAGQ